MDSSQAETGQSPENVIRKMALYDSTGKAAGGILTMGM